MFRVFDERQIRSGPERKFYGGDWHIHMDRPERLATIREALCPFSSARDYGPGPLNAVHSSDYLTFLETAYERWSALGRTGDAIGFAWPVGARSRRSEQTRLDGDLGFYGFDTLAPIGPDTWTAAYWSAQTALTALEPLLTGSESRSFALCSPPGHHAGKSYYGGYCYLNNAAIAAAFALAIGAERVAILDLDYDHGNGTQDIFYESGKVLFASLHADPASHYPFFWGFADERGSGAGLGANFNLPLEAGTDSRRYLEALRQAMAAIKDHDPDLLIVSFGADTYGGDPFSDFKICTDDFGEIGAEVSRYGAPILVTMEGGYDLRALGKNIRTFLQGLG